MNKQNNAFAYADYFWRTFFAIGFIVLVSSYSKAQTRIIGHARSVNEKNIPGASVKIKKTAEGTATDTVGNFSLTTNLKGHHWLICSAMSYGADSVMVNIKGDSLVVNFLLKEKKRALSGISIITRKNRIDDVKREYAYSDFDIVTTPGALADVVTSLQTMPGSAPSGNETGLFIHGGAANETQAFFDGLLVKNPFGSRLPDIANRSRFSAFLFQETAFSTAGYSTQYGQALSSALSLETKSLPNKTSNEFSITTLGGGAAHTQRFKNSSLVIGANYYNFAPYDKVIKQNTRWDQDPNQYDGIIHFKSKVSKTGTLKIFANYSSTSLSFYINNPNLPTPDLLANTNNNLYLNTNYQDYLGPHWKVYAGAAYNYTLEKGDVNKTGYDQTDKVCQEKISASRYIGSNSVLTFGAEQFQNSRNEGYDLMRRQYTDVLSAGFIEAEIALNKQLVLKAGGRLEYTSYLQKSNIAPRTSLAWYINPKNELIFSWGNFYQKPDDSFLAQTADLQFEKATNYNLDYQIKIKQRHLRIQAYYKNYQDLVKITTPVFSGFQAYGPPVLITGFNNNGSGYAKGIDVFLRDFQTFKAVELLFSYSYLDTKRDYLDFITAARPAFAPAHTLNLITKKLIMKYRGQLAATYTLSSGRTYFNPNNPVFMGDETGINQNLSLGFSYMPKWFHQFSVIQFSASNVLGFNQVYGYRYAYNGSRREPIVPPARQQFLLSFLMNIGDGWFNH